MLRIRLLQAIQGLHPEPTVAPANQPGATTWTRQSSQASWNQLAPCRAHAGGDSFQRRIVHAPPRSPRPLLHRARLPAVASLKTSTCCVFVAVREPSGTGGRQILKQKRKQTNTGQRASRLSRALCQFSASSRPAPPNAGLQRPPTPLDIPKHFHCLSFQGNGKTSGDLSVTFVTSKDLSRPRAVCTCTKIGSPYTPQTPVEPKK